MIEPSRAAPALATACFLALTVCLTASPCDVAGQSPVRDTVGVETTADRSPRAAFHWSLWSTVIPLTGGMVLAGTDATDPDGIEAFLLIVGGLAVGPAAGHLYGGDTRRAWTGAAVRGAVVLGTAAAFIALCERCLDESEALPYSTFLLGSATVAVLAVRDIAGAPGSVRAHRQALSISPLLDPRGRRAGLRATVAF